MPDEQQAPAAPADVKETNPAASSAETKNTDNPSPELMIPKHRYDEVSKRLKTLEEDLASKAAAQVAEDEKRLAAAQEWQKLAEKHKDRVAELAPKAELADKLTALVVEQYDKEIQDWPDTVKNMAPGGDATILTKLEWMQKAKPLALELMADKAPVPGNGGHRPAPISQAGASKAADAQRQQWGQQAARRFR